MSDLRAGAGAFAAPRAGAARAELFALAVGMLIGVGMSLLVAWAYRTRARVAGETSTVVPDGVADVERWLAEPVSPEPDLHSELFAKVVLALMLGRKADGYLDAQRAAHLQRMRELTELKRAGELLDVMLADHAIYRLEADLRWIDHTAARLDVLARAVRQ